MNLSSRQMSMRSRFEAVLIEAMERTVMENRSLFVVEFGQSFLIQSIGDINRHLLMKTRMKILAVVRQRDGNTELACVEFVERCF